MSCNTATGAEAAKTLAAVPPTNFMLNWDPGNAAARGEVPYPNGYDLLPKKRIGHCHCKDVVTKPGGEGFEWMPVGKGTIDWVGQFRGIQAVPATILASRSKPTGMGRERRKNRRDRVGRA